MALSFDAKNNFAITTVATAPSPATSGTSLIVNSGDGAKFPTAPFNAVVWPANTQPSTSNAEVVRVTAISTDTLTITRTQEGTSARTIGIGDQIAQNITKKYLTDIESAFQTASASIAPVGSVQMWLTSSAPTGWVILDGTNLSRSTYSELFGVWGTTFGSGDGSTTFGIPDMRQSIPIGLSSTTGINTLAAKTGSWNHSHGPGTLTVASHTHGNGSLTVASHSHGPGTLQVASHTHGAGTLTVSSHTHDLSVDTTFTDITHSHTAPSHTHTYSATTSGPSDTSSSVNTTPPNDALPGDFHTHSVSGTTDSGGGSSTSSDGGSHRHSVNGQSTNATAPTVGSGLTASTAPMVNAGATDTATPSVNGGATGATAPTVSSGSTDTANPPVIAVNFIVRASSAI